jgi:hypothetical protein
VRDPTLHERPEALRVPQVEHPHTAPRDLVLVRWSDAATGRADLLARRTLAVEQLVIRHDQMGAIAHIKPAGHIHTIGDELLDLIEQRVGIEYDAVADGAANAGMKNPAGDLVEDERATADRYGMARVRAALVSHDPIGPFRDHVDELPFAFVAPLGADDDERADLLIEHEGKVSRSGRETAKTDCELRTAICERCAVSSQFAVRSSQFAARSRCQVLGGGASATRATCSSLVSASLVIGKVTVNVLPRPYWLATAMSPPRSAISFRVMLRPRPVPPYSRVRD